MLSHSIPHKRSFTQVDISQNPAHLSPSTHTPEEMAEWVQLEAFCLYDMGFNVFPLPYGKKSGYPWRRLQYTRLNEEHELFGLKSLFAGQINIGVMCGKTSGNLFVIDCESVQSFDYHQAQLRKQGIPVWAVKTARGGHLYLRCIEGEVDNVKPGVLKDVEIRGRGGYVLAPPSVHPSGIPYTWVCHEGDAPPLVSAEQINWLLDVRGQQVVLEIAQRNETAGRTPWQMGIVSPLSNLSNATREYIDAGHLIPEGSRNNRLFSAACDLCGNHYSQAEAENLLLPPARGSGLPEAEVQATIRSAYSQSRVPARPKEGFMSYTWQYALIYVANQEWGGHGGSSRRSFHLALIERCRIASNEKNVFRASVRELAELARLSTTTVQRYINKILDDEKPLLRKAGYDKMSGARLFAFSDWVIAEGKKLTQLLDQTVAPHWLSYSYTLFESDAVERGSVGKSALFLYEFMRNLETPYMPSQLEKMVDLTLNQINYALRRLSEFGLAYRKAEGWLVVPMNHEALEQHVEAAPKGEKRQQRHQKEREILAGQVIFYARLRSEGGDFADAIGHPGIEYGFVREYQKGELELIPNLPPHVMQAIQEIRNDPVQMYVLELGGVRRLDDGTGIDLEMVRLH